ncbi:endonuclease domain-containing protein [Legionella pneumophila]|uniref:Restriction endonuclease-like n=1 Tax=Legionella pneumophila subsp. pascullei TaxID=91890 RepID=A0AAX2ITR0_LEGPN|nr:endonuclease domain-containing protein [Legionella pneumophila]AMP90628.1 DNA-cytosine methyltransferase [Legionella pneumophila subsp. pascullei]AMP91681.1 DNA-cytosine methyltransferase [Legionella pneumophila subsp. pascullei]AMP94669.1 DNA-cytosine methyltransferase [Legionella pneumophila subsp. pascullei]SQG89489.1 putative restriction endonuclease-like [Legionella pneumophila subsp. pascullei]VEH04812.1 putative restriction endonuclease-like [Legionella pneumophila subsp. pascullei]
MVPTDAKLLKQAKSLRQRSTDAEKCLWYCLRAHRLKGYKFKRQVPIGNYIVDFVCIQRKLIVELDGGQHLLNIEYDQDRSAYFSSLGYKVLRFWNDDVLLRTGDALESIVRCLEES